MNIFNVLTYTAKVACVDNVITIDRMMLSHQNFPLINVNIDWLRLPINFTYYQ